MSVSKKLAPITDAGRKLLNRKVRRCGAVIVAAGSASRMKGLDKIMEPLQGTHLIAHTVDAFSRCGTVSEIVVVTRKDLVEPVTEACKGCAKPITVVEGGADRPASVENGLQALSSKVQLAAIHDGARPLIDPDLIDRVVRAANVFGAAAPGVPVKDTVKVVENTIVTQTPDRKTLRAIQTPQVFDYYMLRAALEKAREEKAEITDDCSAVERMGMSVKIIEGDERNLKVTTPTDLAIVRMLLEEGL